MKIPFTALLVILAAAPVVQSAEPKADAGAAAAVDAFGRALQVQWSYYRANGADFQGAVASLRRKVDEGMDPAALPLELQKIIALGIDGHAAVGGVKLPDGYLPFLIEPAGSRMVALHSDRTALLDAAYPFVTSIDGRAIEEWCKVAATLVPKGSPQLIRSRTARLLRNISYLRRELGMAESPTLRLQLTSSDGRSHRTLQLEVPKSFTSASP